MVRPTVIGQDALNLVQTARRWYVGGETRPTLCFAISQTRVPDTVEEDEFVGREPELAVLDALLGQVRTRGARVVLIRGAVGSGRRP